MVDIKYDKNVLELHLLIQFRAVPNRGSKMCIIKLPPFQVIYIYLLLNLMFYKIFEIQGIYVST